MGSFVKELGKRLPFSTIDTVSSDERESRYKFEGTASLGGLLTGHTKAVVSPIGM